MGWKQSFLHGMRLLTPALAIPLLSCTVTDQLASRAIEYNVQSQKERSSVVLLNILRAAFAEPI